MEELRLSHAWPPLARFCAAAAFFVGVSVMVGCGGGGGSPSPQVNVVDDPPPLIAFGQVSEIEALPIEEANGEPIEASGDVYTLNVRSQSPRTVLIAVEGGDNAFTVTQSSLIFVAGERSKPVTLQAVRAINDIFADNNFVVTMTFGLRDISVASITSSITIRFVSDAARGEHGRNVYP